MTRSKNSRKGIKKSKKIKAHDTGFRDPSDYPTSSPNIQELKEDSLRHNKDLNRFIDNLIQEENS